MNAVNEPPRGGASARPKLRFGFSQHVIPHLLRNLTNDYGRPRNKCGVTRGGVRNDGSVSARNLGATAATFEGHGGSTYGVGNLHYQFGRKTPFAGTLGSPLANIVTEAQNFAYVVKNPTAFIGTGTTNWSTQDQSTSYMWNDKNIAVNTDAKSIFDPSPIGWRMPINGVWSDFLTNATYVVESVVTYTAGSLTAIYPAVGTRSREIGNLGNVNTQAQVWTSTNANRLATTTSNLYFGSTSRPQGSSIRAIRE